MDKAEYKAKLNDINTLAENGDFKAAADKADTIDWRHVKSPRTLAMISEIYEANKRYDDALRLMKSAYKRSNGAKSIVYRLAELSLKLGDVSAGRAYADEFEKMAGSDASKYVLRYKVKRTEGSPLSEQIKVLETLKEQEYTERWAYELARLYHKNGQDDKCVDECDDLILWFNEGRYVAKAMELKMEIRPLTAAQRRKYQSMITGNVKPAAPSAPVKEAEPVPVVEEAPAAPVREVPTEKADADYTTSAGTPEMRMAFSESNRENVQNQLADSIRNVLSGVSSSDSSVSANAVDYSAQTFPREDIALKDVMSLEKEASDHGVVTLEREPEEDAEKQMSLDDLTADEEIDLKDLFAETGSKLASALAEDELEAQMSEDDLIPEAEITPAADEKAVENALSAVQTELNSEEKNDEDSSDPDQISFDFAGMLARTVAEAQERIVSEPAETAAAMPAAVPEETEEDIKDDLPDIQIDMSAVEAVEKAAREEGALKTEEQESETEPEAVAAPVIEEAAPTVEPEAEPESEEEMEDIRLGLTREFNFNAELQKAMTNGADMQDAAKAVSSRAFAEAAKAQEAYEPIYDTQEIPKELLAEPLEQAQNDMTDMVDISAMNDEFGVTEESRSIIEDIMEEPERMMIVPVESRRLDDTEVKTFTYFAKIPGVAEQVTQAIADVHNNAGDKTSMSGNVVIVGRQGSGKTRLADALILSICRDLNIKAAKMAHVIADDLNKKDVPSLVAKLSGGFLIIEGAGSMSEKTVADLSRSMEFRTDDMVVILEDEKQDMRDMLKVYPEFAAKFTSQITVPVFTNDELVTFGRTYCKELGYKMDEMCVLALYTMIGDNQKDREPVTVGKVQSMIDTAIARAEKGSRKLGRRLSKKETDESGRIILHEKDFNF